MVETADFTGNPCQDIFCEGNLKKIADNIWACDSERCGCRVEVDNGKIVVKILGMSDEEYCPQAH